MKVLRELKEKMSTPCAILERQLANMTVHDIKIARLYLFARLGSP